MVALSPKVDFIFNLFPYYQLLAVVRPPSAPSLRDNRLWSFQTLLLLLELLIDNKSSIYGQRYAIYEVRFIRSQIHRRRSYIRNFANPAVGRLLDPAF
jgi:hypothetical protein